jgi:nucleoside 2-deoxyribosyltransferase
MPRKLKTRDVRPQCFVMMPFAGEFDDIYQFVIKPTVESEGFICRRADEIPDSGVLLDSIVRSIAQADLIIVDVSKANPNVFYELGIAHSLGKNVLIIAQSVEDVPFDIRHNRLLVYGTKGRLIDLEGKLREYLVRMRDGRPSYSPVLAAVPEMETVPKSDLDQAINRIAALEADLKRSSKHYETLRSSVEGRSDLILLKDELKAHLDKLAEIVLFRRDDELEKLKIEIGRLEAEGQLMRSAQAELRRLKQMTLVNPHWQRRRVEVEDDLCFLLMPFRESWSDDLWALIEGTARHCNMRCERADEQDGRVVMNDIWEGISRARVVIADLTGKNPNVTYEVGLADVLGKEVVLLSQAPHDIPFDFLGLRLIVYENSIGGVKKLTSQLEKRLNHLNPRAEGSEGKG